MATTRTTASSPIHYPSTPTMLSTPSKYSQCDAALMLSAVRTRMLPGHGETTQTQTKQVWTEDSFNLQSIVKTGLSYQPPDIFLQQTASPGLGTVCLQAAGHHHDVWPGGGGHNCLCCAHRACLTPANCTLDRPSRHYTQGSGGGN